MSRMHSGVLVSDELIAYAKRPGSWLADLIGSEEVPLLYKTLNVMYKNGFRVHELQLGQQFQDECNAWCASGTTATDASVIGVNGNNITIPQQSADPFATVTSQSSTWPAPHSPICRPPLAMPSGIISFQSLRGRPSHGLSIEHNGPLSLAQPDHLSTGSESPQGDVKSQKNKANCWCPDCGTSTGRFSSLSRHLETLCESGLVYICKGDNCRFHTRSKKAKKEHDSMSSHDCLEYSIPKSAYGCSHCPHYCHTLKQHVKHLSDHVVGRGDNEAIAAGDINIRLRSLLSQPHVRRFMDDGCVHNGLERDAWEKLAFNGDAARVDVSKLENGELNSTSDVDHPRLYIEDMQRFCCDLVARWQDDIIHHQTAVQTMDLDHDD